ncbi:hypothetical protein PY365_04230 [Roseiarcaceae bacterium H3SJ34-1]|uniref:hypothetical protein n=1 Tax=Terripilifer ovatus TaxID=3032367 RepID=UPI003AB96661|nr:hypothetical protein [Roseiarcaceae bacterium H3SJ34-1]
MSYPAIIGAAGLVLVSIFAMTEPKPRIKTKGEFSLAQGTQRGAVADQTIADDEKSAVFIGLPTAPEGE